MTDLYKTLRERVYVFYYRSNTVSVTDHDLGRISLLKLRQFCKTDTHTDEEEIYMEAFLEFLEEASTALKASKQHDPSTAPDGHWKVRREAAADYIESLRRVALREIDHAKSPSQQFDLFLTSLKQASDAIKLFT